MSTFKRYDYEDKNQFIQLQLEELRNEFRKTYNLYLNSTNDTVKTKLKTKMTRIRDSEIKLIKDLESNTTDLSSFEDRATKMKTFATKHSERITNLNNENAKLNKINKEINNLTSKKNDAKLKYKLINIKYLITFIFVIVIIILTIRTFIYLESNNIDIIILISIIFLIAYQMI